MFINGGGVLVPPPPPPAPPSIISSIITAATTPPVLPPQPTTAPDVRGYSGGWCTAYVAAQCPWIPAGLGDAQDWGWRSVAAGLEHTMIPTVGSVCCYRGGGLYSALGHVAVVTRVFGLDSFEVSEMAYVAWNQIDLRISNMQDVQRFILPPGVLPGDGLFTAPAVLPQGLDGVRGAWASLADFIERGLPAQLNSLGGLLDQLRSLG